ncbi:MAG: DUF86 domain-containing protein [Chloroflexi bacterium]|nr:DUF86 domain-containing protein [Chloroflexota bacterium]
MPHNKQAQSYLWDMREAARDITGLMRGVKFHEFEKNKTLRLAVERLLTIIGEAASHISPQYRNQNPEVEWKNLIGFRNVLAHEYGETLLNRVWLAATVAVPELLAALLKLLPDDE